MISIFSRCVCLMLLIFIITSLSFAQGRSKKGKGRNDRLITAMISAEGVAGVWGDDAMSIFAQSPEIQAIFDLGNDAIPLLIDHLDDKRLIRVSAFNMGAERQVAYHVTVGAACFDLLSYIIRRDARFFKRGCVREMDEGHVSSCAKSRYAVFPEDFWSGLEQNENGLWLGKTVVVPRSVIKAKINWQTAYRKHWIHYERFDE